MKILEGGIILTIDNYNRKENAWDGDTYIIPRQGGTDTPIGDDQRKRLLVDSKTINPNDYYYRKYHLTKFRKTHQFQII